jgi:hypothetical protein
LRSSVGEAELDTVVILLASVHGGFVFDTVKDGRGTSKGQGIGVVNKRRL